MQKFKRKPAYYNDFIKYKNLDLVFIAKDWNAFNLIQRFNRYPCLLCELEPFFYDLSFCYGKEVWVLYSNQEITRKAMELARAVQFIQPKRVCLLHAKINVLGVCNDKP